MKYIKNKDFKSLIENFLSLTLIQGIGYILPFITLPHITKTIGLEYFGELAYASAIIMFFKAFVDYGFNYTAVRDLSRIRDDSKLASEYLSCITYAKIILLILGFIILSLLLLFIPQFNKSNLIILYSFMLLPGYVLFPTWFFQGIEKMKYSAILSFIIKVIFTFSIFIFIQEKEDYILIPIINSVGFLVVGIVSLILLYRQGFSFVKVKFSKILGIIKRSTSMFITLILPNLYTNMSTIFLGSFWGQNIVGIFDSGYRFISFTDVILQVFSRTFYPFLARRMDKHTFYKKISFTLGLFLTILLFITADYIVNFFYETEFNDAISVIKIMSICPLLLVIMNVYGTNYLVLKGKEKELRNIVVVCSLIGVVLSYCLISKYSYIGAAMTITIVWFVRAIATYYTAKKIRNN